MAIESTIVVIKPRLGSPGITPYATMGEFLKFLELYCWNIKLENVSIFNVTPEDIKLIHGFSEESDTYNRFKNVAKLYQSAPSIFLCLSGNNAIINVRRLTLEYVRPAILQEREDDLVDNGIHSSENEEEARLNIRAGFNLAMRNPDMFVRSYWYQKVTGSLR